MYSFKTVIFDLDGVVTKTASTHARAWKQTFDGYLRLREQRDKEPFREFTIEGDYLTYVDGKPRYEGVNSFLTSRGINLPFGNPDDSPDTETVCGVGNKKNVLFTEILEREGPEVFVSTLELVKQLRQAGIKLGVASSSKNCKLILKVAGISHLFETVVDGVVSAELGLKGKPEADIFVKATYNLGGLPEKSVVVEDAMSGVKAGRNGGFGLVIGVAREDNSQDLLENGADVAVDDLAHITLDWMEDWFKKQPDSLDEAWEGERPQSGLGDPNNDRLLNPAYLRSAKDLFSGKKIVFFLDYDGTLTPIVERPDLAVLSDEMRKAIQALSSKCTTAIVSGRLRTDVENLVKIEGLFYAGSHGFDISGPGSQMIHPEAEAIIPVVSEVISKLKDQLSGIEGLLIEEKKFSVAVHYRLVAEAHLGRIKEVVDSLVSSYAQLRLMQGKKVFEILPAIDWNKGKAVRWIMNALDIRWEDNCVVYIGDDTTDEDAFRVIRTRGVAILVSDTSKASTADFRVANPDKVKQLFEKILALS